jgi:hypothetical protein
MLCRAIGALTSENDTAGFELPFHAVDLKQRIATPLSSVRKKLEADTAAAVKLTFVARATTAG